MEENEGLKIRGWVTAEELIPGTDTVVSREVGENIICKSGADAIATALTTGTLTTFNYMAISTDTAADARATLTIPGSLVPTITKFMSTVIVPTVALTGTTSITTWVFTFAAASGRTAIKKFGMETTGAGTGACFNEYSFTVVKDNTNNDLKLTYNVSIAP